MRRDNLLVFDDVIMNPTSTTPVKTSADFDAVLGTYDLLIIQAVVTNPTNLAATLVMFQNHCADGKTWMAKNGTTPLLTVSFSVGPPYSAMATDPSGIPNLAFVQFSMYFSAACNARVKLYVTIRDQGAASAGPSASQGPSKLSKAALAQFQFKKP